VEPGAHLTAAEHLRYARQLAIPELGDLGQRRLRRARVLCVGAGGLGSPVLMYLAAAGIGTIGIVDFDTVDVSNLQRQIAHGQSDLGRPKADSAGDTIAELNPSAEVVRHVETLTRHNAPGLCAAYDLVVDGTDNVPTRYLINEVAAETHRPYVWGAVSGFEGQVSVFWADRGPCYRCLYPPPPEPDAASVDAPRGPGETQHGKVPPMAGVPVLGPVCAMIGAIQAAEVIKLLTGVGDPLVGAIVVHNALTMTFNRFALPKNPTCQTCASRPATA
jgi:adenylyltransferase/sulfurtransferase